MTAAKTLGDRFRIEERIGEGGMGIVYKAFDCKKECSVAVKTLKGEMEPASIERFRKEWKVLADLNHPNIVDVLDVGTFSDDGHLRPYFVMPLLRGYTLDKLIRTSSPRLTPERVIDIISQTCRGLQTAHDHGVVHCDLKPSNLFVLRDDAVKIIDFGIVRLVDAESRTDVRGTPHYIAPELLDMKPPNARSDIFSLAVVCYEALTGQRPFEGSTMEEVIEAIRTRMPSPAWKLNPKTSDNVSKTVQKAMAKQPYHRFSSAREFSEMLQLSMRNPTKELFPRDKIQPRINRIKRALDEEDYQLATDMLDELESEGHLNADIFALRDKTEGLVKSRAIHQLIESARTRMEETEYPLAIQNIGRALDLDPANVDARTMKKEIEQRRGESEIDKWLQTAQHHFDNKAFEKSRQAIDEIQKADPAHQPALDLLAAISRGEEEINKLHQERQQLYDEAREAYGNGDGSALGKLERVLDLGKKTPGPAGMDAQYLAFYEELCSERDALQDSYAEGKRALEARNFTRAVEICNEILHRRPNEALFKALKNDVEAIERQEKFTAIAQFHLEIEAEPDLEKKFSIVSEAAGRFPDEETFAQSLKLIDERRDLVNSELLARADQRVREYPNEIRLSRPKNTPLKSNGALPDKGDNRYSGPVLVRPTDTGTPAPKPGISNGADRLQSSLRSEFEEREIVPPRLPLSRPPLRVGPVIVFPSRPRLVAAVAVLGLLSVGLLFIWRFRAHSPAGNLLPAATERLGAAANALDGKITVDDPLKPSAAPQRDKDSSSFRFRVESLPRGRVSTLNHPSLACNTPCELPLPRGEQTLQISAPGYNSVNRSVNVPLEQSVFQVLSADLKAVRISSDPPDADLAVDNEAKGRTPITLRLSLGPHSIRLTKADKTIKKVINVTQYDLWFNISLASAISTADSRSNSNGASVLK